MPLAGVNRRLLSKPFFRIEGPPFIQDTGFTTMSELKDTTEVIEHRQGGSLYPVKSPGLASVENVTLTRGATSDLPALLAWYRRVSNGALITKRRVGGATGAGLGDESLYKFTIDIVQTDRAHRPQQRWRLFNAFPTEFVAADGQDNNANERVIETIVLAFDYFELVDKNEGSQFNLGISTPLGNIGLGAGQDDFVNLDFRRTINDLGII